MSVKDYFDLRIDEIKLILAENMGKVFSRLIFFFLLFILWGITLGLVAAALSSWISALLGSKVLGPLVTAGVFLIAIIVFYIFRDRFFRNSPLRMFIRMFFNDGKNGKRKFKI